MGWLTGWNYRKSHVINPATGAGTLYQKQITVHYGAGADSDDDVYCTVGGVAHCKTDFGDIRFTDDDGSTLLDYWMESKVDSDNAVFWVEVADSLESAAQTIYVYYGKADAATTSNGDNTFSFFDDFDGSSLDAAKWSLNVQGSITYTVADGKIKVTNATYDWIYGNSGKGGQHSTKYGIIDNVAVEWKSEFPAQTDVKYMGTLGMGLVDSSKVIHSTLRHSDAGGAVLQYARIYYYEATGGGELGSANEIVKFTMTRIGTALHFYVNGVELSTGGTLAGGTTISALNLVACGYSATYPFMPAGLNILYLYTRKYVSPEPAHGAWGTEETAAKIAYSNGLVCVQT